MKAIAGRWCALVGLVLLGASSLQADYWDSRARGPGARVAHTTVFTGKEIIVWGGGRSSTWLNDGARYDLATDTWTPISGNHNLEGRWWHVAVWTGKEMIVWGGRGTFLPGNHYNNGARYNPASDTWKPMSIDGAPSPRSQLTAVWTGSEMIVWGGGGDAFDERADGARYNPDTDTWTPLPPSPLAPRLQHTAVWSGTEMIVFGGLRVDGFLANEYWETFADGARYDPVENTWALLNPHGAPSSRTAHSAVWTGTEMIVWGGRYLPDYTFMNSGASYDPARDRWTAVPATGAPTPRMDHAAVWSGTEMIVWGGVIDPSPLEVNTGGRYNPATQTWTPTTQQGAAEARYFGRTDSAVWTGDAMFVHGGWGDYPFEINTTALYYPEGGPVIPPHDDSWEQLPDGPGGRACHTTVLAGDQVIVWGGGVDGYFLNNGGRFDLDTRLWRPVSTDGAPSSRWFHGAVWTGREMIIWGGRANFFAFNHNADGGRYDPARDRWTSMSQVNAPSPRSQFSTVWTGSKMIVWGGMSDGATELADGGAYDPERDRWTRLAPCPLAGRSEATIVWTGSEVIVFGGLKIDNYLGNEFWASFGDGARYNPQTDRWEMLNSHGAPGSRTVHTAVWTGSQMLVWGGRYLPDYTFLRDGAAYDPVNDSWTPIATQNAPQGRAGHTAAWTGEEMIVWGGWIDHAGNEVNTGGRYNPASGIWRPTTLENAPHQRFFNAPHSSVWTGAGLFIYGGYDYPVSLNSAHLYHVGPSPLQMLQDLVAYLRSLDLPRKAERPLLISLRAALDSLERGKNQAAANQLEAFQQKVQSQLGNDPTAQPMIDAAQTIVDKL